MKPVKAILLKQWAGHDEGDIAEIYPHLEDPNIFWVKFNKCCTNKWLMDEYDRILSKFKLIDEIDISTLKGIDLEIYQLKNLVYRNG